MATYTVTLSKKYPELATYSQSSISYITDLYYGSWSPPVITVPKWKSGAKTFNGYYSGSTMVITSGGIVVAPGISQNASATESWSGSPIALLNDGSNIVGELVYDGGLWYWDFKNKFALTQFFAMPIPSKTNYKFLGIFSTNASSGGTKYVDENGYATISLMNLVPTSDKTFYYRFQLMTKTITISASNGTWGFKKLYQKISDGAYTRNSNGKNEITGIQVPVRECYRWGGLRKSSSSTSTLYANPDGTFTSEFLARSAADATVYGDFWTQVSYKITVDATGGDPVQDVWYIDKTRGGVYADDMCQYDEYLQFPLPHREGYYFDGYFSAKSGGIRYTDAGSAAIPPTILDSLKTVGKSVTIYAHWRKADVTITLDPNGGKAPTDHWYNAQTIYYDNTSGHYYNEYGMVMDDEGLRIPLPTYTGNIFDGYYDQRYDGSKVVSNIGYIIASSSPATDVTWYARWIIGKSKVSVNGGGGSGGTEEFYYDIINQKFYSDSDLTQEISSVTLPTLKKYDCDGLYNQEGNMVVDANGVILASYHPTEEYTQIEARYTRRCWEITLDPNGGTTDIPSIYYASGVDGFYADDLMQTPVVRINAYKKGNALSDFTYGDTQIINSNGDVLEVAKSFETDYTTTAQWTKNIYILTFVTQGGTVPPAKSVLFGSQIGSLPKPTWKGHKFIAWTVDGVEIKTTTKYTWGEDKQAIAKWETAWGYVQDYWGLGNANLVPIASDDGSSGEMIHTANGSAQYAVLQNPSVTYMVIGQTTLKAELGGVGTGPYMLTQVTIDTRLGQPPTVTATGVANEGASAINRYNVEVRISPRHRAQRLADAIVEGGELQSCTFTAKCDPVVVYDMDDSTFGTGKIVPIASDVVHGLATVQATTAAYNMESAPYAGNGYTATQVSEDGEHVGYKAFNIQVEKEI